MSVKWTMVACLLAVGCGPKVDAPQDWMIGVFSTRLPGTDDEGVVDRYRFEDDGALTIEAMRTCNSMTPLGTLDLEWEAVGENEARVATPPEEFGGSEAFVLQRLESCDEYRIYRVRDGVETIDDPVYRGEICLRRHTCPDADGNSVDCGCVKEYCDGPPPPLDCAEP